VHQLAGGDPGEDEPLKPIYGQPTSAFTWCGIEHRIALIGTHRMLGHAADDGHGWNGTSEA